MLSLVRIVILGVICVLPLYRCAIELDGEVLVLDDDNFSEATTKHNMLLVEFYAPWCGHCKTLAPEYAKAADTLKGLDLPVKLAKVDATEAKTLAETYGIKGFPTLKYFKNGVPSDYEGGRTEKDIVSWLKKKSGPAFTTVSDVTELTKFQNENDAIVIGVFDNDDDKHAIQYKEYTVKTALEAIFLYSTSAAIRTHLAIPAKEGQVVVLKNFDEKRDDFKDFVDIDGTVLDKFIESASTPLIQEFTQDKANKIFGSDIKRHTLLFTDSSADYHAAALAALDKSAKNWKGSMLFITIPSDNTGIMGYFGLTPADCPALIVADMTTGIKKFPLDAGAEKVLTSEAVYKHIESFFNGEIEPSLKSEEPTPEDTAGNVKVAKGKSFKELVLDSDADVLLEIYAPWCGHCKKLDPIYEEVAKEFADNDKIMLVKMDGTANEINVPGIEASGFPSLFFLAAGKKSTPVAYSGGREKNDLVSYIKKHATHLNGGLAAAAAAASDEL